MTSDFKIQTLHSACELYKRDPVRGFTELLALAEAGSVKSMAYVGHAFETGKGVKADLAKAISWYERAADGGSVKSMAKMGYALQTGWGVKADLPKAIGWYERAADGGSAYGMFQLGTAFQFGRGKQIDLSKAIYWYENAYQRGHRRSGIYLGSLFLRLKQYDESERILSNNTVKDDPAFMYWLSKVYIARGERIDIARDLLERAALTGALYARGGLARLFLRGYFGWRGIFRGIWLWITGVILVLWQCRRRRPFENPKLQWW